MLYKTFNKNLTTSLSFTKCHQVWYETRNMGLPVTFVWELVCVCSWSRSSVISQNEHTMVFFICQLVYQYRHFCKHLHVYSISFSKARNTGQPMEIALTANRALKTESVSSLLETPLIKSSLFCFVLFSDYPIYQPLRSGKIWHQVNF